VDTGGTPLGGPAGTETGGALLAGVDTGGTPTGGPAGTETGGVLLGALADGDAGALTAGTSAGA
jgi:hypothetical protein